MIIRHASADRVTVATPAKLNLYLEVGPARPDGFHDIDSVFQAISIYDELEFRRRDDGEIALREEGIDDAEDNLVYRAARRLADTVGAVPGVDIALRKGIPFGAGLGGGSSDVAATLVALARLWNLDLEVGDLESIGVELGSDVAFFFHGGTARCRGRGEKVSALDPAFDAQCTQYVLVCPHVHVSTPRVYAALDARDGPALTRSSALDSIPSTAVPSQFACGELFFNRFEEIVCDLFPELARVRGLMRDESFVAVLMSGSGSSFFGLCESAVEAEALQARLTATLAGDAQVVRVTSLPAWRSELARR